METSTEASRQPIPPRHGQSLSPVLAFWATSPWSPSISSGGLVTSPNSEGTERKQRAALGGVMYSLSEERWEERLSEEMAALGWRRKNLLGPEAPPLFLAVVWALALGGEL